MSTERNLIVSTEWLAEHLHDSNLRIIDIRGHVLPASEPLPHYFAHHTEYLDSHIPGAVFVNWTTDIVQPGSLSQDIAGPEQFAALMERLGIGSDTLVIAYDDAAGMFAARMWWALRYYGHLRAAVLDGGWQKWVAEGRPVTNLIPSPLPAQFVPQVRLDEFATAGTILERQAETVLLDVRTVDEYEGRISRVPRAGHIPGAVNLPRSELVTQAGTLPSAAALRQIFAAAGISLDAPEHIVYCNAGVSASYGMLALMIAGARNVRVYDGSWKDWGRNLDLPSE